MVLPISSIIDFTIEVSQTAEIIFTVKNYRIHVFFLYRLVPGVH